MSFDLTASAADDEPLPAPPSVGIRFGALRDELFGVDLRSLAAFRICLALLVFVDVGFAGSNLTAHYTDEGVFTRAQAQQWINGWGPFVHMLDGSAEGQSVLLAVQSIVAASLLVGFCTQLSTVVSWILLLSLQARNPMVLQGGDIVLRMMFFWGMFVPLGARWSIDALRRIDAKPLPTRIVSIGCAGLLLQTCFVYFFSAVLKNSPDWRTDGTAIYYALNVDPLTTDWGRWLLGFPLFLRAMTHAVFWLEAAGPFLAFSPFKTQQLRFLCVVLFVGFHVGLSIFMSLGTFPYISEASWIPFLPAFFWNGVGRLVGARIQGRLDRFSGALGARLQRSRLAIVSGPDDPGPTEVSRWGSALAAAALAYVLVWNLRTIGFFPREYVSFPRWFDKLGYSIRLDQRWAMFAPYPLREDGWYVIVGELRDKSTIDVFHGTRQIYWGKPEHGWQYYRDFRWHKFLTNMANVRNASMRPQYADYVCRQWNAHHTGKSRLRSITIYYIIEETQPDYQPPKMSKAVIYNCECAEKKDPLPSFLED